MPRRTSLNGIQVLGLLAALDEARVAVAELAPDFEDPKLLVLALALRDGGVTAKEAERLLRRTAGNVGAANPAVLARRAVERAAAMPDLAEWCSSRDWFDDRQRDES